MNRRRFEPGDRVILALNPTRSTSLGWREQLHGSIVFSGYLEERAAWRSQPEVALYSVEIDLPATLHGWPGSSTGFHPSVVKVESQTQEYEEIGTMGSCAVAAIPTSPLKFVMVVKDDPALPGCIFPETLIIQESFFPETP